MIWYVILYCTWCWVGIWLLDIIILFSSKALLLPARHLWLKIPLTCNSHSWKCHCHTKLAAILLLSTVYQLLHIEHFWHVYCYHNCPWNPAIVMQDSNIYCQIRLTFFSLFTIRGKKDEWWYDWKDTPGWPRGISSHEIGELPAIGQDWYAVIGTYGNWSSWQVFESLLAIGNRPLNNKYFIKTQESQRIGEVIATGFDKLLKST